MVLASASGPLATALILLPRGRRVPLMSAETTTSGEPHHEEIDAQR